MNISINSSYNKRRNLAPAAIGAGVRLNVDNGVLAVDNVADMLANGELPCPVTDSSSVIISAKADSVVALCMW
jgi:hypothetical protein